MGYIKTNWVNNTTELNAENMNHIEDGIFTAHNVELIAISDTAPATCSTGDKYYNTEDSLIYTATGTNTWGATGEEPISGIFYILFSEQSSYSYDGTTLVSVGGGTEDIVISDTEPTEEGVKIWIDTGEISQQASEITNEYSTSTGKGYACDYANENFASKNIATTEANGLMSSSDKTLLNNLMHFKKYVKDSYYQSHGTATATITFPSRAYHIYFVQLYTRFDVPKTIKVTINSSGNAISITGDTTIVSTTLTTNNLVLTVATTDWNVVAYEITSLASDSSAQEISVAVGA